MNLERPVLYVCSSTHTHIVIRYYIASLYLPLLILIISPIPLISLVFLHLDVWMFNSVTEPRICLGDKKDEHPHFGL